MNLEKLLDEFYSTLDFKPVSSNAIALYLIIVEIIKNSKFNSDK